MLLPHHPLNPCTVWLWLIRSNYIVAQFYKTLIFTSWHQAVADILPICPHATNRYFMPRIWKIWVSNWDINTMQLIRTQNNRKLSISNLPRTFDYGQNSNNWKLWFLVGSLNLSGIFERLEDSARLIVMANKGTRNISPWANSHPCWLCVN